MNKKTNPVYYCNYDKKKIENQKIFNRNFCSLENKDIVLDFKPNNFICQEYKTINDYINRDLRNKIDTCGLENVMNTCEPNRGNYLTYLKKIDIDTELRNINRKISKCPEDLYLAPSLARLERNNPNLIKSNQRIPYKITDNLQPQEFVSDKIEYEQKLLPECNRKDMYVTGNCKTFNYDIDLSFNRCATLNSNVKRCDKKYDNIKDPYLNWTKNNKCNTNAMRLVVGPVRKDHDCDNLFNNNTKRRFMNCKKPIAYQTNFGPDFSKNTLIN